MVTALAERRLYFTVFEFPSAPAANASTTCEAQYLAHSVVVIRRALVVFHSHNFMVFAVFAPLHTLNLSMAAVDSSTAIRQPSAIRT